MGSLKDYEDLLARLKQLPQMVRQVEALLREGVKQGVTYARESLGGVDALNGQKKNLKDNIDENYFEGSRKMADLAEKLAKLTKDQSRDSIQ